DRVEEHFGPVRRGEIERPMPAISEPRQVGRRDFTLAESESVARAILGWHTVPRGSADGPALDVLSDLLSSGRRSRLWNGLVEKGKLASWVEAAQEGSRWAGQFLIQVETPGDVEPQAVEAAIRGVIDSLGDEGPTAEELARARRRLESAWRWEQEDL